MEKEAMRIQQRALCGFLSLGILAFLSGCAESVSTAATPIPAAGISSPSPAPSHTEIPGSVIKNTPSAPSITRSPAGTFISTATLTPTAPPVNPALHTQALPEGAIARLGKGEVHQVAVSDAANAVAAATSIGVYVYHLGTDGHTLEEAWFGPTTTPMRSVAFSPDGTQLATGSQGWSNDSACDPEQLRRPNGIITTWNVQNGEPVRDYPVSNCYIEHLEFAPDGRKILFRGFCFEGDLEPSLLDLETGEVVSFIHEIIQGSPSYTSMAVSPDESRIAVGYDLQGDEPDFSFYEVTVIPLNMRDAVLDFRGFETPVTGLAFSPDGGWLAVGSEDGLVSIWEISTGWKKQILPSPGKGVRQLAFSPSGRTMASVYEGSGIALWDTADWKRLRTMDGKGADVLGFSKKEPTLLSAGEHAPVIRWEITSGESRHRYPWEDVFHIYNIGVGMDISPDGKYLAAGGLEGNITLFDLEKREPVRAFQIKAQYGTTVALSPDGKKLAGSADGVLQLWNYQTGSNLLALTGDYPGFSPDGRRLAYSRENNVVVFNRISGKPMFSLPAAYPRTSAFVSGGRVLAYAAKDGVALLDLTKQEELYRWKMSNYGGMHIASAPGRNVLAIASLANGLAVLDVDTLTELPVQRWDALYSLTVYAAFSMDGKLGAYVSGNVAVWNVDTGYAVALVSGHTCHATSAKFTPDGKILATDSYDDTILLWDLPKIIEMYKNPSR
jgi:WD40 repeat protein